MQIIMEKAQLSLSGKICADIRNESKKQNGHSMSDHFVIRMRLERMTVCLEGRCSIQLSYRTKYLENPNGIIEICP